MGKKEVERFLNYLTEKKNVAAATKNQALNALVFLYKKVLDINLGDGIAPTKSKAENKSANGIDKTRNFRGKKLSQTVNCFYGLACSFGYFLNRFCRFFHNFILMLNVERRK